MKIAFFTKQLPSDEPNGVSVQVHRLAEALVKLGHEVVCFSFSPKPDGALYNHRQLEWRSSSALFRKFTPGLVFRKIDSGGFDVVHYHGDDYLCRGAQNRARTFYGSALLEALHSSNLKRFLYQALFYCFELVSCIRKGAKVGISRNTCRVLPLVHDAIPCCVPIDTYKPGKQKSEKPSVLFVGGIHGRKRGRLILDVFSREILPAHCDCLLYVVGPEPCSGTNVVYMNKLAEKELIKLFQNCWVYCMASSYEGFGVPAIEAMACGTAVAAVKNPGVLEVIQDGSNGVLCSEQELGRKVNELIDKRAFRSELVQTALEGIDEYDSGSVARQYEKIYRDALSKARS
ncbi:MAG: glycosyltransferase family 4 protein [Chitinispirillaceae bacterium]